MKRTFCLLAILAAVATFTACGGGSAAAPASVAGDPNPAPGPNPQPTPAPGDTTAPSLSIAQPTSSSSFATTATQLTVSGTASDNAALATVTYVNGAGGNGTSTVTGTSASWSFTVALQSGVNQITVTARDAANLSSSRTLTVTMTQPAPTPVPPPAPPPSGSASIQGLVDTSLIAAWGTNAVYAYSGSVVPSDIGGSGTGPLAVALVGDESGTCRKTYSFPSLPAGTYTLAFTPEAEKDDPGTANALRFTKTAQVTVNASGTTSYDFPASKILRVGPTRTYKVPSAAADAAQNGDVIEIDAGQYIGDVATWNQDDLTLRGIGGRAHINANGKNAGGKGTWLIYGQRVRVENIEFSGATVPDQNGAGIRHDGVHLTVCGSYFHDNENGVLGSDGDTLIEYSEFANNGLGDGYTHNMYIGGGSRFMIRYSYSHHAKIGHNVKTRAKENYVLYNRIMDEQSGTGSYAVDIPDSGRSYVIGNLLQQGPNTDNAIIVAYGAESAKNGTQELYFVNNTVVNDRGSGTFLDVRGGTTVKVINNIFAGSGTPVSGVSVDLSGNGNLVSNSAGLANMAGFDYRLTSSSPARDKGIAPGTGAGFNLIPVYQYLHPTNRQPRPQSGATDIGAYEYQP